MRALVVALCPGTPVALEAAYGWPWIADLLEEMGLNPIWDIRRPSRSWPRRRPKATDRRRPAGQVPTPRHSAGSLPGDAGSPPMQRERTRYRMALSALRTGVKNRIQAILHRLGILHPFSDLFGKAGRRFLQGLDLPEGSREGPARASRIVGPHLDVDRASGSLDGRSPESQRGHPTAGDNSRDRADSGTRDLRGNRRNRALSEPSALEQLRGLGAGERRFGRSPRPAALQPGVQSRPALGLDRSGYRRAQQPRLPRSTIAEAVLPADAWRPMQQELGQGSRGTRVKSIGLYHLADVDAVYRHPAVASWNGHVPRKVVDNPRRQLRVKQAMRSDQPRALYGPLPANGRRPGSTVIGPFDAAYPFCAEWILLRPCQGRKRLPQHVGIIGFLQTAKCREVNSGLPQLGHKLMRRRTTSEIAKKGPPHNARQAHQLVDPRRRSGRTPALPYPPPKTRSL